MTPARPKKGNEPKTVKTFDRKSLTPKKSLATEKAMVKKKDAAAGKKPGMGPNVVNKLTAGSSSKMDKKAMLDKLNRKSSGVSPKPASGGLMGKVSPKPASGGLMGGMMGGKAKDFMDKMKRKSSGSAATTPSVPAMKKGGMCGAKKYAKGGGIEVRGKTKGKMI